MSNWVFVILSILVKLNDYHDLYAIILNIGTALPLAFRLPGLGCSNFECILNAFVHSSSVMWIMYIIDLVGNPLLINR
jgi:hypothetical protein